MDVRTSVPVAKRSFDSRFSVSKVRTVLNQLIEFPLVLVPRDNFQSGSVMLTHVLLIERICSLKS